LPQQWKESIIVHIYKKSYGTIVIVEGYNSYQQLANNILLILNPNVYEIIRYH